MVCQWDNSSGFRDKRLNVELTKSTKGRPWAEAALATLDELAWGRLLEPCGAHTLSGPHKSWSPWVETSWLKDLGYYPLAAWVAGPAPLVP